MFVPPSLAGTFVLKGDPIRLHQVLLNLVGNAVKFTDEGHIIVTCSVDEEVGGMCSVLFAITDTGVGMSDNVSMQHSRRSMFQTTEGVKAWRHWFGAPYCATSFGQIWVSFKCRVDCGCWDKYELHLTAPGCNIVRTQSLSFDRLGVIVKDESEKELAQWTLLRETCQERWSVGCSLMVENEFLSQPHSVARRLLLAKCSSSAKLFQWAEECSVSFVRLCDCGLSCEQSRSSLC